MKKIITIFFFLVLAHQTFSQTIHYRENFSTASGCTPPTGWTVNVISGSGTWCFNNPSNRTFGQSISGSPFAIFEDAASGDNASEVVELISPAINLTGKNKSKLSFYEYFEGGFNGKGEVYFRSNATDAWSLIHTVTTTSISNPDKIAIDLQTLIAQPESDNASQVKFVWSGDNSFWWIIDDVFIYDNPAKDAAALKADNVPSGCVISLEHPIIITIKNMGSGNLDNVTMNYQINGDSAVSEVYTFSSPLTSNSTFTYAFDSIGVFRKGNNSLKLWPSNPGSTPDEFPSNDTIYVSTFLSKLQVANLPFLEDFEDTTIAASICIKLGASGNGRVRIIDSSVVAPCTGNYMLGMDASNTGSTIDALDLLVDLSSCVTKELSFTYGNLNDEQDPADSLYISVDNGATYTSVYGFDMALSNDTCIDVRLNLDSVAASKGMTLSSTSIIRWRHAGNNSLESDSDGVYLDNIKIQLFGLTNVDAMVKSLVEPSEFPEGDTLQIKVAFGNLSDTTLATANFNYQYGNGPIVTEFWGGCLQLNQADTFTFSNLLVADSSISELCIWITNPNDLADLNNVNNKLCFSTVGINKLPKNSLDIKVIPNPAKKDALLTYVSQSNAPVTIRLMDMLGNTILNTITTTESGQNSYYLDLSEYADGMYIYQITSENKTKNGKLIIVK